MERESQRGGCCGDGGGGSKEEIKMKGEEEEREEIASVWVSSLDKFTDEMESQMSSRDVHVQTNDTKDPSRT